MNEATMEEEMNGSYELETTEYDDNDEGTVEYLDLNLVANSIPETIEQYVSQSPSAPLKKFKTVQSSVLKTTFSDRSVSMRKPRKKRITRNAESSVAKNGSSTEISIEANDATRSGRETNDVAIAENVHAVVDAINARLAESTRSVEGRGKNESIIDERTESRFDRHAASGPRGNPPEMSNTDRKSTERDSLDLFFQSMAQTVLHLPSQVQAKIKMDICKVIAMAEIKYNTPNF